MNTSTSLLTFLAAILLAPALPSSNLQAADRHLVIVAGSPSHPPLMHEFNAGCLLLEKRLAEVPGLQVTLHTNGWPEEDTAFEKADAIFLYMDGGGGHPAIRPDNLETLRGLIQKGVGLGCAHFAVEVPADRGGQEFKQWIGGHYEHQFSCNPIFMADFKAFPDHPVTRGITPFEIKDEWYFNMRFRPEMKGVTSLLVTTPSDDVRDGPYVYPQGPYDHIIDASGREETLMWAVEREDGGRGFGFTGGHFHVNWAHDEFRQVVLNALLWLAKVEVPESGLESRPVTAEELLLNLDPKNGPKPTLETIRRGMAEASPQLHGDAACQPLALPAEALAWIGVGSEPRDFR